VDALKGLSAMQNKSLGVAMLATVSHLPVVVAQLWIDWFDANGAIFSEFNAPQFVELASKFFASIHSVVKMIPL
jgi:hypothetical protein